jgi:hypothetical protein
LPRSPPHPTNTTITTTRLGRGKQVRREDTITGFHWNIPHIPGEAAAAAEEEEAAEAEEERAAAKLKVGDVVRVRPSVERPWLGWNGCSHASVGTVVITTLSGCFVDFPGIRIWFGWRSELEVRDPAHPPWLRRGATLSTPPASLRPGRLSLAGLVAARGGA